jgi:hypothetical protein
MALFCFGLTWLRTFERDFGRVALHLVNQTKRIQQNYRTHYTSQLSFLLVLEQLELCDA